jgi:hypothetical protein
MKKSCLLLLPSLVFVLVGAVDSPTAREVMQAVEDRDDGDNAVMDLEMILIDKRGNERIRKLRSFAKDFGEDDYQLMFFLAPADVKETGFLTFDYDDEARDDDQWLYLPALKKTKRIAAGDKSGSFMGSDFSYADMTDRPVDYYDYKILDHSDVKGVPVWIVEAVPRTQEEVDETGVTKTVSFVRKDNYVVIRTKIWLKKGKRNKYFDVKKLEQIDGIWVATEMHMATKKGKKTLHRTVLKTSNVSFDQDLGEDLFSTRRLEKGL